MKSSTPNERMKKALFASSGAFLATTILFLSFLLAALHWLQSMKDIFYGTNDSVSVADEVIIGSINKMLGTITIFMTVLYFLFAICAIVLVYFFYSSFQDLMKNRRKSSFAQISPQRTEILNEDLLDPVGLCKVIDQRILRAKNKNNKSELFALDYLYLSRTGIVKPRTKLAYQKAFLESFLGNSQFSDKVKEIEDILDNERLPDTLDYRGKFSNLKGVFKRFEVSIKSSLTDGVGNLPENDRKSE